MGNYSEDPLWEDIVPVPQDDGGPNPLAAIAYTDEYSEAMSYLRAVMAKNEMSERTLQLTEDIIDMNAAHYTVWLYRAQILAAINADLHQELEWLNETALAHQKNYQIWHHRQLVVDRLGSAEGETEFIAQMFELDSKNYHVWSYRQWLVKRFGLWEEGELETTEQLIGVDVRNNSAWNHRFFVVCGNEKKGSEGVKDRVIRDREVKFAQDAIREAPQNQSPWNYLRGIMAKADMPISEVKDFAHEFASIDDADQVSSSHALDLLAEIYAKEGEARKAARAYDLLASKYDPIRANYWDYLKNNLPNGLVAA